MGERSVEEIYGSLSPDMRCKLEDTCAAQGRAGLKHSTSQVVIEVTEELPWVAAVTGHRSAAYTKVSLFLTGFSSEAKHLKVLSRMIEL